MLSKVSQSIRPVHSAARLRSSINRAPAPQRALARSYTGGGRLLPFVTASSAPSVAADRLPSVFSRALSAPASSSNGLRPLTSVIFSVSHAPGSLQKALSYFWKHDINMTRLESRPSTRGRDFTFHVSFEGDQSSDKVKRLLKDLGDSHCCTGLQIIDAKKVPWFPTRIQDVELFANQILDAGTDLQADHPGFSDKEYRKRRQELANIAMSFRFGERIPRIEYTDSEIATWNAVFNKLYPLYQDHACKEHLDCFNELMKHVGYAPNNIPQAQDISEFLRARTGFSLRPVAGLLSARNFLYGLAFRVFFSTQYIRHHSKPLYTPEPDICHELMGHVPLFGDRDFADFSQEIGLASIGATDEQILKLSRCYWFSVEFGLCKEKGKRKAYGAGLLSSFGELEYAMSDKPEVRPWDPFNAAEQDYPITTYQPVYYSAESFEDAKIKMKEFSQSLVRPFNVRYNDIYQTIEVDTTLEMLPQKGAAPAYSRASA